MGYQASIHALIRRPRLIGGVLVAGTLLYQTLVHLGHPPSSIQVHHLAKGLNVHSDEERDRMTAYGAERIVLLDQGSRPGRALIQAQGDDDVSNRVLIIDHHMSDEASRENENAEYL